MKKFLLLLNTVLFLAVIGSFGSNLAKMRNASAKPDRSPDRAPAAKEAGTDRPAPGTEETLEQQMRLIANANIFNPDRAPRANSPAGNRTEMVLAGTFRVGDKKGAIIILKQIQFQPNPFLMPFPMATDQQIPPGNSMRQRLISPDRNSLSLGNRQSVLVGGTLANGYKLVEVNRASAVVVCGSDRRELSLQDPTAVLASANRNTNRPQLNTSQQLQQAQIATQRELMRVMQSINRDSGFGRQRR